MLERRLAAFGDGQIDGFGAGEFNVGAGGIEVSVVGDDVAFFTRDSEENALCGAALVRGDDMLVTEDVLDGIPETIEAAAAGITFIAFHDGGPLMRGHGAGAGVSEEVDENVVGGEEKKIVMRGLEKFFALRAGRPADGLDALDAKGFDDGFGLHGFRSRLYARGPCGA